MGRYLADRLDARGLEHRSLSARLGDSVALADELALLQPAESVTFIHLAARVSVPACEADPQAAHRINVELAVETARQVVAWATAIGADVRLVYVSTGHVYAAQPDGVRCTEDAALAPRSTYARTKLEGERALTSVAEEAGVSLQVARVFGLIAPRQPDGYVLPGLIRRVVEGRLDDIPGLDFARDYLDARDVCDALIDLAESKWTTDVRVVNVCSGLPVTIRELLAAVADASVPAIDPSVVSAARAAAGRPDDIPWIVGDPSRLAAITGHSAGRIPLATTVAEAVAAVSGAGSTV